ncbi:MULTISPECIES: MlaC/ttg2D family ABC transporter substrate-binding protein [Vibrio]|uniref:MlaC/ttg2D family ABC transporter substrate-binding protein n=1 Tax=Vibrio TaxID=662 RepID=UPI000C1738CF|nr:MULTISPECIES: phospholipid-binding protein MlaC [Vibrio]NNN45587.1 phospholipid-binding protein MlaC [Vibrio sp. 1-1(7)]NNN73416.1 phospholipid-binding protein MlaC [Vibrio sp. 12-2(3-a)]
MLKRSLTVLMTLLCSWASVAQVVIDQADPYLMMKEVAQVSFDRLKADQKLIHDNPEHLKVIVEQELMPYVNEQYAALKLLGPHLKGAKREDVGTFIHAFRAYLVSSYAQVLTQYSDQEIVFGPETAIPDDRRIASIKVEIIDTPRPNINLEFKLRKEKDGNWKAFDMVAEGISLLSSKQSEWSGKIRQEGILAVAKELQTLADQPIRFESNN